MTTRRLGFPFPWPKSVSLAAEFGDGSWVCWLGDVLVAVTEGETLVALKKISHHMLWVISNQINTT